MIKPHSTGISGTFLCLLAMLLTQPSALLADARSDGESGIEEYRKGNLIEGMQLLEKSAKQGYAPAQTTLAYILDAAEKDAEAFHWYQQAARHNDAAGLFGLGSMYARGEGTEKDLHKASQLIKQAAQLDYLRAIWVYANALEHGDIGLDPAPQTAVEWYLKAARLGDTDSMRRLKEAYTLGHLGLPIDPQQATAWNEKLNQPK